MFCLDDCLIHDEAQHGEAHFYRAEHRATGQQVYLLAEPEALRPLPNHPGLSTLRYAGAVDGLIWQVGDVPTSPSLKDLWLADALDTDDLADCLLQVVEALAHLASTKPGFLPDGFTSEHVRQVAEGTWALDLAGLALSPGIRLGSGGSVIKPLGTMLQQLLGDEAKAMQPGVAAPTRHSSPAVRFIMMRCLWGGFASLAELRNALSQLSNREVLDTPSPPIPLQAAQEDSDLPPDIKQPIQPLKPLAGRRVEMPKSTRSRGLGVAVGVLALLVTAVFAVSSLAQPAATVQTVTHVVESPTLPEHPPQPVVEAVPLPSPVTSSLPPAPAFNDVLSEADLPLFERKPEPIAVTPAPTPKPAPKPVQPAQPADPVAAADKATAGNNLVTVRLYDHTLGQVYMFTNPGAAVISLDSFSHLLKRPLTGEVAGPGRLRVVDGARQFETTSFFVLENRVWLILKPELVAEFGLGVVSYRNGVLNLEPRSRKQ